MLRTIAISLLLALSASTAQACLWDRETNTREVEFKRQYNSPGVESMTPTPDAESSLPGWVMLSVGGVLGFAALGTGVGVGIAQTRKST